MAEQCQKILSLVSEQLSTDLPDYAFISILLGLFEAVHTAKQPVEPSASERVRPHKVLRDSAVQSNLLWV